MTKPAFHIDLNEKFPHLAAAPIVEAVIQWTARAELPFESGELQTKLESMLPDYPNREPQYQHEFLFRGVVAENQRHSAASHQGGWHGFRVSTADKKYIAQITRDSLVFSRLLPYEDWDRFSTEALRLWKIFVQLAGPSEVQRLGVRFVNRIEAAKLDTLDQFLKDPPTCPSSLQLNGFLYQSTYKVPGHPFLVQIVKTLQPELGLILDIDVGTTKAAGCDEPELGEHLSQMRWLKNKIFFDLLTKDVVDRFKRG